MLWALAWVYFKIGLFSFGGGYASIALIQSMVVEEQQWMSMTEFTDILALSQMTPGPIGINCATFVGWQIGGVAGSLAATINYILPSILILMTLAWLYLKYRNLSGVQEVLTCLRPAVVAVMVAAGWSIILLSFWGSNPVWRKPDWLAILIFAGVMVLLRLTKISPFWIMLLCGLGGGAIYGLCSGELI
ncbi:MAG: chromate transporter [Clostridia bacterium]|nr:chromate transporter [Clostridia bacterium]